ncbi:ArsR/SmtB family transcription factor [Halorutilales archaeon Cl-col2-1]
MDADRHEEVIDAVHNDHAREILVRASEEPVSASCLIEEMNASKPTVYRQLDDLENLGLVRSHKKPDPDGHHRDVYITAVEEVRIRIESGEYSVDVEKRPTDAVDRFTELVEDLS